MLDPWIIEEIRRREDERRREGEAPRIDIPLERERHERRPRPEESDEGQRGVVIIDM